MTRLFIGTLKGVVFEWFMKLSAGFYQEMGQLGEVISSLLF